MLLGLDLLRVRGLGFVLLGLHFALLGLHSLSQIQILWPWGPLLDCRP